MVNSRQKGAAAEREFAQFLRDRGYEARRGQQFQGTPDSPDVVHNIDGIYFEVKRREAGNIFRWLDEAGADCDPQDMPIIAHRRNQESWVAILSMEDLLKLVKS